MLHTTLIFMTLISLPLSAFAQNRNYVSNGFMFIEGPVQRPAQAAPPEAEVVVVSEGASSEVTSAATVVTAATTTAPTTSLLPKPRPAGLAAPSNGTGTRATLYDMSGCTYIRGRTDPDCYRNMSTMKPMSTVDRARRIMHAVNYINQLHNTHFDGRYMLCTGYRESTFNPGAKGADGERGMFQVMTATGRAALRYGVELPEFDGMSSENYMTRMANSTVAQVELSFLVLKMKLAEAAAASSTVGRTLQTRIMSGNGSVDNYRSLAGRYNGGGYNSTYAKRISSCYSCLRGKMSATSTNIGSEIQTCLNKAK